MVKITRLGEHLVLTAPPSELLITADHVAKLQKLEEPREFVAYFCEEALTNRSARRLFAVWLKKEQGLWQRIYKAVRESP